MTMRWAMMEATVGFVGALLAVEPIDAQRPGEVVAPRFVVDPFWPKPLPVEP